MKLSKNNTVLATVAGLVIVLITVGALLYIGSLKKQTAPKPTVTTSPSPAVPAREPTFTFTKEGIEPQEIEIKSGGVVVWINDSGGNIELYSDDHLTHQKYPLLNFGAIKNKAAAQLTFDKPGTYGFHNHLKPEQKGVVIVK